MDQPLQIKLTLDVKQDEAGVDALNNRDWRIYHDLAMRLILRARELYAKDPIGIVESIGTR